MTAAANGYLRDMTNTQTSGQPSAAREFARAQHADQPYDGGPYDNHLAAVAAVLDRFGYESETLHTAAWLHDVVEDTETEISEVESRFGADVATLVWAVTSEPGQNRKERNALTYPKIRALPGATILKLADRIANVENGLASGSSLTQMYRKEHPAFKEALYVPGVADAMWAHLDQLLLLDN
jgi:(p)ppGpp synthase/HD superfamily hydrolase